MTKKFRSVIWNKYVIKETQMSAKIQNIYSFNNLSAKIEILNTNNRKCLIQKQKMKLRDGTVENNKCKSGNLVIEK